MRAQSVAVAMVVVVGSVAGCGGGTARPPDLTEPVTVAPTSPPVTVEASTTGVPATDAPTTTVAAPSTVPGALGLSAGGPWTLVDSAPGVEGVGLTYELMPKLWVFLPTEVDLDKGIVWTFNEQDRPVIEAYLMAMLTRYRSTDSVPATLDDEGWDLYYTDELAAELTAGYQAISDAGEYTDLDLGVVLRPRIIEVENGGARAIVMDCRLDGAVRRNADGSLAGGATPGVIVTGYAADLGLLNEAPLVVAYGESDAACA